MRVLLLTKDLHKEIMKRPMWRNVFLTDKTETEKTTKLKGIFAKN